ncbi:MAG: hypothetical protein RR325_01260 [Bacilli bacterium]
MSLFTVLNYNEVSIIDSISLVFSNYVFLSLCILPIFLFLTIYIYDSFVKDIFAITRFENRTHYLKELFKNIFVVTALIFLIIIAIVMIIENVINFNGYKIVYSDITNCFNLVYTIFVIIKLYVFIIIYSLINTLLIKTFNSKIIVVLNFIFFATIFYCGFNNLTVTSVGKMPLFIGNYLVNNMSFISFKIELITNIIMYGSFTLFLPILVYLSKKNKKDIN